MLIDRCIFLKREEEILHMCHIILAMPLISLVLFYYLPFKTAIAIYLPVLFLSLLIYYKIKKAMEAVPKGGMDEMMGKEGVIIESLTPDGRIRVKDEIWNARSTEPMMEGERGRIVGFDGLTLIIEPIRKNPSL
jgi:membrane protein implicated in regulation of membrane protease activity